MKLRDLYLIALFLIVLAPRLKAQDLELEWALAITSTDFVNLELVDVDNQDNYVVSGLFQGTTDFDPSSGVNTLNAGTGFGNTTPYVAKYNSQGVLQFVFDLANDSTATCSISGLKLDNAGNIWIAGSFIGTVDFDPSAGTALLTNTNPNKSEVFIAKYDGQGIYQSVFVLNGNDASFVEDLHITTSGDILICGEFKGDVDVDPSASTYLLQTTESNGERFIASYSNSGSLNFAHQLNSQYDLMSLASTSQGEIYVSGQFIGVIDLDPSSSVANFNSLNGVDGFIGKYSSSGAYITGFSFDATTNYLDVDQNDNLFFTGKVPDSVDIDAGPNQVMLYSKDNFDVYYAKYTAAGVFESAQAFESKGSYDALGLDINTAGEVILFGRNRDTVNFNPGGSGGMLAYNDKADGFLCKYGAGGNYQYAYSINTMENDNVNDLVAFDDNLIAIGSIGTVFDFDFGNGNTSIPNPSGPAAFMVKYKDKQLAGFNLAEHSSSNEIKIAVSDNVLTIELSETDFDEESDIRIFSINGQLLASTVERGNSFTIDLSHVPPSIIVVMIENTNTMVSEKLTLH